jgi:amino acid adenylation domain-containing protein
VEQRQNNLAQCVNDPLVPTLVLEQARRAPSAIALVDETAEWSYGSLCAFSSRLAAWLERQGAGPERRVAVCAPRSCDAIASALGVLLSGAAYVALDPENPPHRLERMISTSEAMLVLADTMTAERLRAAGIAVPIVSFDQARVAASAGEAFQGGTWLPEHPAYVVFTSGSTGEPKGVECTHAGLRNLVAWHDAAYEVTPRDRATHLAGPGFDASVWEVWPYLAAGASVHVVPDQVRLSPDALIGWFCEHRITMAFVPTPLAMRLLHRDWPASGTVLRALLTGGERLPRGLPRPLPFAVFNHYGPTECTVVATHARVPVGDEPPPIGRPLPGVHVVVAGPDGRPVADRDTGELLLGGVGLARGYCGRPDLTAERFLADASVPGGRLYRTGDLVRINGHGELEFVGRVDHQLKIRGVRIEPGEIESALCSHPAVREAAVVARSSPDSGPSLVAHVVLQHVVETPALRAHLEERLPRVMTPSAFVVRDALPLTSSGKVDRARLAEEEIEVTAPGYAAPETPLEIALAAIWSEILGVDRIGRDHDFFVLGGHSLAATEIASRIEAELGRAISLRDVYQSRTVAALASRMEAERASAHEVYPVVVPAPDARFAPFPLTEIQEAYWVGRNDVLPLGGVSAHVYSEIECRDLDLARLEQALQVLVERHDMLRAIVAEDGSQRILPSIPPLRIPVDDLRGVSQPEVEARLAATRRDMSHRVMPADRAPMLDLKVSLLEGGQSLLHLGVDGLTCDDWSMQILSGELHRLYLEPGHVLPPLGLCFRDYALAQASLRESSRYQRAWRYWEEKLPTLPAAPELPLARALTEIHGARFSRRLGRLGREQWQRLQARARRSRLTDSGVLLAAYAEVLATWSRRAHFTLNLTIFNRVPVHPQVKDIVGDFTSLSLLEVDRGGADSFDAFARGLQERLWQDLEHRDVSGVRLLRELARARGSMASSLLPVVFTSLLGLHARGEEGNPFSWLGREVWGISQTPQAILDHQVIEENGNLVYYWDAVEEVYPAGLLDAMFAGYGQLLEELATEERWTRSGRELLPGEQRERRSGANATGCPVVEGLWRRSRPSGWRWCPARES